MRKYLEVIWLYVFFGPMYFFLRKGTRIKIGDFPMFDAPGGEHIGNFLVSQGGDPSATLVDKHWEWKTGMLWLKLRTADGQEGWNLPGVIAPW